MDVFEMDEYLAHYGVGHKDGGHSGRYPWGSGKDGMQRPQDFLDRVNQMKADGWTETADNIREAFGCSTTDYRAFCQVAKHDVRAGKISKATAMLNECNGNRSEAARRLGMAESSLRSLLDENTKANKGRGLATAEVLKKELKEKGIIDVGKGVETELGISNETMKEAITILENEGYVFANAAIKQVTQKNKQTPVKVIASPEMGFETEKDLQRQVYQDPASIKSVMNYMSDDGGYTYKSNQMKYPTSIDSNRIKIVYAEDGGLKKDGLIEIRRGVDDLSLGQSHYAQVRILTDNSLYLKGMALYSDNVPDGYDIAFYTNKSKGTPKEKVFKPIEHDEFNPNNPFGAAIDAHGQTSYTDNKGNEKLSAVNKIKEEGKWEKYSKSLSQQFVSKQSLDFARKQLNLTYADKEAEFEEIMAIENPTVRRKCLEDFAGSCDSDRVELKCAAMPRQHSRVLLPMESLKDNEVYAPDYKDGETVVLIRYPHEGTFQIPRLVVNNKNAEGKSILGNCHDAIGINSNVAEKLSGADFDGDSVTIFPVGPKVKVNTRDTLEGLKGFSTSEYKADYEQVNPKTGETEYYRDGKKYKLLPKSRTSYEMGVASNLITDMTLGGASEDELARATRHSMVVIDAAKHKLDYKQSYIDNGIDELKKLYQRKPGQIDEKTGEEKYGGAATLLSRRKQDAIVPERRGQQQIDPETGAAYWKESGRKYYDKDGNLVPATIKVPKMSVTEDAHDLSSGTDMENLYADYANKLLALGNRTRKELVATPRMKTDPTAKKTYEAERESLKIKVERAEVNAPRERQAQAIANSKLKAMIAADPTLTSKENKKRFDKIKTRVLNEARETVGAGSAQRKIELTDREWEAINNGAVSDSFAQRVFRYCEDGVVRDHATPRSSKGLSTVQINRIKSMDAAGYTIAQIAARLGVSTSTVSASLHS